MIQLPDTLLRQNLFRPAEGDQLSMLHRCDPVTIHGCDIQVMNGRKHRQMTRAHQIHDLQLVGDIQMIRRFIQDKTRCLLRESPREHHALLLPAGEKRKTLLR